MTLKVLCRGVCELVAMVVVGDEGAFGALLIRWFTVSLVCCLKRRVSAVLGKELSWTGDSCC